jgi:hypothetical protein
VRWGAPSAATYKSRTALMEIGVTGVDGRLVVDDWAGPTGWLAGELPWTPGHPMAAAAGTRAWLRLAGDLLSPPD